MSDSKKTVVVLGASNNPERYSNQALRLLLEHGYKVIPIHPALEQIEALPVLADLASVTEGEAIDTLTVYVSAKISSQLTEAIIALKPKRVIFNPGAENEELAGDLRAAGILVEEACTLVLLRTGQF
jgi:predicted CoA-binding protein